MPDEGPRPPHRSQARDEPRDGAAHRDADLSGVALVTGAGSGIGRALAEGLAARGMAVAGLARSGDRLRTAMDEIAAVTGSRTLAVTADVTDRAAVDAAVAEVAEQLGRVDLLVNSAGAIDGAEEPLWEADPDQWWDVVSSHVRGGFLLSRAVVPWMVLRNRGRIVNLASGMSVRARPQYSAYSVAKTGLMRLTEALEGALEGTDVHAFDVAPGVVDTPMTRSMAMWQGFEEWTPVERVVGMVAAIAAGELDAWGGRLLHVAHETPADLAARGPEGDARRLRLRPWGDGDPLG